LESPFTPASQQVCVLKTDGVVKNTVTSRVGPELILCLS
jgi:hypothetical protein